MNGQRILSAESVCAGNPNKVADILADAVLDSILARDRFARVNCKVLVSTGLVMLAGEVTCDTWVDAGAVVRKKLGELGYDEPGTGFDAQSCAIMNILQEQSEELGLAVDRRGAGDQGTVVGYACDEGEGLPGKTELLPVPVYFSHQLARQLCRQRIEGLIPGLRPDGRVLLSVRYADERPAHIDTVVVFAQHRDAAALPELRRAVQKQVIEPVLSPSGLFDAQSRVLINPSGPFTRGGPPVDAGFTGMLTAVDAYGPAARQASGGFSGKDPTKPDRSGSYLARHLAKNLVAAGLARRCEVSLTYVTGQEQPLHVQVDEFGTGQRPPDELEKLLRDHCDLGIPAVIESFDLRRPIYSPLSCFGQFGRPEAEAPWERLSLVEALARSAR
jgi:S-adenosylmethionine synthetase